MTDTTKTCSRSGCSKTLRASNTTGRCASGCLSLEAPPSLRAKGAGAAELSARVTRAVDAQVRPPKGTALSRFKAVCDGLGKDPDEELEAFAQGWLDALRERLEEGAA
jgi:hypothetical protein